MSQAKFKVSSRTQIGRFFRSSFGLGILFSSLFLALILFFIVIVNNQDKSILQVSYDALLNIITEILGALLLIWFGAERLFGRSSVEIYNGLPEKRLLSKYAKEKEHIEIIDSFTMVAVGKNKRVFKKAIIQAVQKGAKVRIILLQPNSAGLKLRTNELVNERFPFPVPVMLHENTRTFYEIGHALSLNATVQGEFEVKLTENLPESTIYVVGDELFHAPFPREGRSDKSETLWFNLREDPSSIGIHYRDEFDRKWEGGEVIYPHMDEIYMCQIISPNIANYPIFFVQLSVNTDEQAKIYVAWFNRYDHLREHDYEDFTIDIASNRAYEFIFPLPINQTLRGTLSRTNRLLDDTKTTIVDAFKEKYGSSIEFEISTIFKLEQEN